MKVVSWYDNEMGYSDKVLCLIEHVAWQSTTSNFALLPSFSFFLFRKQRAASAALFASPPCEVGERTDGVIKIFVTPTIPPDRMVQ